MLAASPAPAPLLRRGHYALIASAFPAGLCLSLVTPLMVAVLERRGVSEAIIGVNSAMIPLAVVLLAPILPRIWPRLGLIRGIVLSVLLQVGPLLVLPWVAGDLLWLGLRFTIGLGMAGQWILSESWLNMVAPPAERGRLMGLYGTVLAAGYASGPLLLMGLGSEGPAAFVVAAGLILSSLLPLPWTLAVLPPAETVAEARKTGTALRLLVFLRRDPSIALLAFVGGVIEMVVFTLLTVYVSRQGGSAEDGLLSLTLFVIGNITLQLPLGMLIDRLGSSRVLPMLLGLAAAGAALLSLAGLGLVSWVVLVLWGGAVYGLYTLGLVLLGRRFTLPEMAAANACFVLVYELGSVIGPPLCGKLFEVLGPASFPWSLSALALLALTGWMGARGWRNRESKA